MSHGHARHHFDASGDDDVVGAGHDALAAKCSACWDDPHWRSIVVAVPTRASRPRGPRCADVERLLADLGDAAMMTSSTNAGSRLLRLAMASGFGGEVDGCQFFSFPLRLLRACERRPRLRLSALLAFRHVRALPRRILRQYG